MAQGTVIVRVLADTKQIEKMSSKMMSLGSKLSLGLTAPLALLGKAAVDAGSDLTQSMGAVDSVFGEARDTIDKFAKTAAQAAGLSKREVNEMASVLGASLKGMGYETDEAAAKVVELQKRAADMAATFGGTTQEALDAVASLMRGERDPIERFGVSIKQVDVNARIAAKGLDTSTAASKKHAEAVAALELLMESTAATAGQFAREEDSVAGAAARAAAEAENAKASLGEGLQPVMTRLTEIAGKLGAAFGGLSSGWQTAILVAGGLLAAIGPLMTAVGALVPVVKALGAALMFVSGSPVALTIAGVVALGAALVIAYKKSETFRNVVNTTFATVARAIELYTLPARKAIEAIAEAIQKAIRAIRRLVNAAKDIPGAGLLGKVSGIAGAVGGAFGKIPGFRAAGGPVSAMAPYVVGERGPELFVPRQAGTVVPNHRLGGTQNITIHNVINAQDLPTEQALELSSRMLGWRLGIAGGL